MWKSRKLLLVLIAAIAAILIAAPLAAKPTVTVPITPKVLQSIPIDNLAAGDTWVYNESVVFFGVGSQWINRTWTCTGVVTVPDINGIMTQCYNMTESPYNGLAEMNRTQFGTPWNTSSRNSYARTSDGKVIAIELHGFSNYTVGPTTYTEILDLYGYFNESLVQYVFPFSIGLSWQSSAAPIVILGTGGVELAVNNAWIANLTFTLGSPEILGLLPPETNTITNTTTVTVPAGTFDVWTINRTTGFEYFSPIVKSFVLMTDPSGNVVAELLSYSVTYPTLYSGSVATTLLFLYLPLFLGQQQGLMMGQLYDGIALLILGLLVAMGIILLRRQ